MNINAFQPNDANTVNLATGTSTGNVALPTRVSNGLRVYNSGTDTVFIKFGTSSSVTAATTTSMPIPGGAVEILSCPPTYTHVAAITASGTPTVYFTTGDGI